MKVLAIGETIWDVFGNEEHLGGATFNFSVHASRLGHDVLFISGVGDDERGRLAISEAQRLGLSTHYLKQVPDLPTGTATVELDAARQPHFQIHRPVAYDRVTLTEQEIADLAQQHPDWIYYGTLHQISPSAKEITARLIKNNARAKCFYDVNLRPRCYTPALVEELSHQATALKLNESEANTIAYWFNLKNDSSENFCRQTADRFDCQAVAVTRGADGCALLVNGEFFDSPGIPCKVADAVGAGDAFSAVFLHGLGADWDVRRVAHFANQVGALVASRPGATPPWQLAEIQSSTAE